MQSELMMILRTVEKAIKENEEITKKIEDKKEDISEAEYRLLVSCKETLIKQNEFKISILEELKAFDGETVED